MTLKISLITLRCFVWLEQLKACTSNMELFHLKTFVLPDTICKLNKLFLKSKYL